MGRVLMRRVLMVCPGGADSGASLTDVKKFTEATATWRPLWLAGVGAAQGTGPSARLGMLFLAAASKLWVFGGDGKSRHPISEAGPTSDGLQHSSWIVSCSNWSPCVHVLPGI
jgi:hypothetical protein